MKQALDEAAVEAVYDALAQALDRLPPAQECAFLCRLCLLLAQQCGDQAAVEAAIRDALAADNGAAARAPGPAMPAAEPE